MLAVVAVIAAYVVVQDLSTPKYRAAGGFTAVTKGWPLVTAVWVEPRSVTLWQSKSGALLYPGKEVRAAESATAAELGWRNWTDRSKESAAMNVVCAVLIMALTSVAVELSVRRWRAGRSELDGVRRPRFQLSLLTMLAITAAAGVMLGVNVIPRKRTVDSLDIVTHGWPFTHTWTWGPGAIRGSLDESTGFFRVWRELKLGFVHQADLAMIEDAGIALIVIALVFVATEKFVRRRSKLQ